MVRLHPDHIDDLWTRATVAPVLGALRDHRPRNWADPAFLRDQQWLH